MLATEGAHGARCFSVQGGPGEAAAQTPPPQPSAAAAPGAQATGGVGSASAAPSGAGETLILAVANSRQGGSKSGGALPGRAESAGRNPWIPADCRRLGAHARLDSGLPPPHRPHSFSHSFILSFSPWSPLLVACVRLPPGLEEEPSEVFAVNSTLWSWDWGFQRFILLQSLPTVRSRGREQEKDCGADDDCTDEA